MSQGEPDCGAHFLSRRLYDADLLTCCLGNSLPRSLADLLTRRLAVLL